jgi:hypothetical protein
MRIKVLAFAASTRSMSHSSVGGPQTSTAPTSSPQAATLLIQSARALAGFTVVKSLTLVRNFMSNYCDLETQK